MERVKFSWHKKADKSQNERPRSDNRYHTSRWYRLSKRIRDRDYFCQRCFKKGRIAKSEVCDHIIPSWVYDDFWDEKNLQGLCRRCNIIKGNEDKRKYTKNKREVSR